MLSKKIKDSLLAGLLACVMSVSGWAASRLVAGFDRVEEKLLEIHTQQVKMDGKLKLIEYRLNILDKPDNKEMRVVLWLEDV